MFGPTLSASGFTICWISGSSLSMKARCIAKFPIPAQKMAMMAISIGLQMGQPGWKCQKLSGYRGASSARRPRANDRTNPASAPTRRTSSVTTLPRLAALCLPLALAAAPAYASQEPVEPMQPDDPLLVNPVLVDPLVAAPLPTVPLPPDPPRPDPRSQARHVGEARVMPCRAPWPPDHKKKK